MEKRINEKSFVPAITINTDASYHPEHKVGGFALYIRFGKVRIRTSGTFKTKIDSSQDAEIMAIGNALHILLSREDLPKCEWLIINCDCKQAMWEIREGRTHLGKNVRKLWKQLQDRTRSRKNKMRHVKAHNGTPDARSYVNDWCDKAAKRAMRTKVYP